LRRSRRAVVVAADRAAVLVADEEKLGFPFALRRGLPDFADERQPAQHDGDNEEHGEVREAARTARHHCENSLPSRLLPAAPLRTSYTPPFCGSPGCTSSQVAALSVIGSRGILRRYFSAASPSSDSGYLPLSA